MIESQDNIEKLKKLTVILFNSMCILFWIITALILNVHDKRVFMIFFTFTSMFTICWMLVYIFNISKYRKWNMATYNFELQGKEITYFLFSKKVCPKCGSKMIRDKQIVNLGEGFSSVELGKFYVAEQHKVKLRYKCNKCSKVYTIKMLAK